MLNAPIKGKCICHGPEEGLLEAPLEMLTAPMKGKCIICHCTEDGSHCYPRSLQEVPQEMLNTSLKALSNVCVGAKRGLRVPP